MGRRRLLFPPERESVLDQYFNDIEVVSVESEEEGWNMIKKKPSLWNKK